MSGVPQGSVLGPLLFIIFINDLPQVLRHSRHMIYADDIQIYHHCHANDILHGLAAIQSDAQAVSEWAKANGLSLNLAKCKLMVLGSQFYVSKINYSSLSSILAIGKVYRALCALCFYKHTLSRQLKRSLVESLVFPRFDYACAVYHDVDQTQNLKLERAQNACVRFVVGNIAFRDHVTPYRLDLEWLSVVRRREHLIGSMAYNIIANGNPSYLASRFVILNVDAWRSY